MRAHAQAAAGLRHSGRELQGRMGPGPGRDQRALRRGADHGRPARRDEERLPRRSPSAGQGDHLHGQVALRARRLVEPHPQCRCGAWKARSRCSSTRTELRHVQMMAWVAGQLKYARDITYFLAPYINSYKRFQAGTFAPTKAIWSGRQPHRRLPPVRRRHQGHPHRMPHRRRGPQPLPRLRGADRGRPRRHRRKLELRAVRRRRLCRRASCRGAKTLRDAADALRNSKMLRKRSGRGRGRPLRATPPNGSSSNTTAASPTGSCKRGFERY
jgi:hypothetical protein